MHGKPKPSLAQWVLLGLVVLGSALAGVLLPWGDPQLDAALGLIAGTVGALACGAMAIALWRGGPGQRTRATHAALIGCTAALAVMSALLAAASLAG